MFGNVIRWWLTGILFFFPFNTLIIRYLKVHGYNTLYITYIDEITIAILIFFAIKEFYKNHELLNHLLIINAVPILVFPVFGIISGIANGNAFIVTLFGSIDYIKYFLVIFIYAAFFRGFDHFQKIFHGLLILAIFLSVIAVIQEVWALVSRYILDKDIFDSSVYLLRNQQPSKTMVSATWRFGMLRSGSLLKNPNILGYFILFILTIYLFTYKKINPYVFTILLSSVIFTVSRSAYSGLFILLAIRFIFLKLNNKIILTASICTYIICIAIFSYYQPDVDNLDLKERGAVTYREFAARKGMEVWNDHPFIGVGPGMFGSVTSIRFKSHVYDVYKFPKGLLKQIGSIDQFWPQLLAEMGIVGFAIYIGIFIALIKTFLQLKKDLNDNNMNCLIVAFLTFLLVIYSYTFGTGFNNVSVVFPFLAMCGICLGSSLERRNRMCTSNNQ